MTQPPPAPPHDSAPRRGCTAGTIALGCGIFVLLGFVAMGILGFVGYRWATQQINAFTADFEAQGYERITSQVTKIDKPVDNKRVYVAQVVEINSEINTDIALMAQVVEISGTVNGDIDFFGQMLVVKPGGRVTGDIRCKAAQVIDIKGTLDGQVTGSYQMLNDDSPKEDTAKEDTAKEDTAKEDTAKEDTADPPPAEDSPSNIAEGSEPAEDQGTEAKPAAESEPLEQLLPND